MTLCGTCKRAPSLRLIPGPTGMWGSNPRISAWPSADPMCPPACTESPEERTVSDRGLTGNLISVVFRLHPRACAPIVRHGARVGWKPGLGSAVRAIHTYTITAHGDHVANSCEVFQELDLRHEVAVRDVTRGAALGSEPIQRLGMRKGHR